MEIRHNFTILCELAVQDKQDRLSLINIFRNVQLDEVPGAIVSFTIATSFSGAEGKKYSIAIDDPSGEEIFRSDNLPVPRAAASKPRQRPALQTSTQAILQAKPAVFRSEGLYYVVLRVGAEIIHREPFGVFLKPKPATE